MKPPREVGKEWVKFSVDGYQCRRYSWKYVVYQMNSIYFHLSLHLRKDDRLTCSKMAIVTVCQLITG